MFILRIYMNGHFVLKVMARAHLSDNIINLNLVTRYNPICLFDIDDHPRALEFRFTFAQKYDTQNITSIIFVLKGAKKSAEWANYVQYMPMPRQITTYEACNYMRYYKLN